MQYRAMKDGAFERIEAKDIMQDWSIPTSYYILLGALWVALLVMAHGWALL